MHQEYQFRCPWIMNGSWLGASPYHPPPPHIGPALLLLVQGGSTWSSSGQGLAGCVLFKPKGKRSRAVGSRVLYLPVADRHELWPRAHTSYP